MFPPTSATSTDTIAVADLNLGVAAGEILGLLGSNGAGKTTTIDILSGSSEPTAGSVMVAGTIFTSAGDGTPSTDVSLCPQFETVWASLTVGEHLELYAKIRGAESSDGSLEEAISRRIAENVELDGDSYSVPCETLSGGQKRRLSIAISLVGNPKIWLLDEPTTGLDPETRRAIWKIVQSQKNSERAIILTTHSLMEADALSTRIAIMKFGRLAAIGPQLHLKNRFGDGFKLSVSLPPQPQLVAVAAASAPVPSSAAAERIAALDTFVRTEVCASAKPEVLPYEAIAGSAASGGGTTIRTYVLPVRELDVARTFQVMEQHKARLGVREFGLTQSTLEDVFVKLNKPDPNAQAKPVSVDDD